MSSTKNASRLGDWVPRRTIKAVNRTGATLVTGDVVCLDLAGADGDVDDYTTFIADTTPDPQASPLANVIYPTTAKIGAGTIFLVYCGTDSLADNAIGEFGLQGKFKVRLTATAILADVTIMAQNATGPCVAATQGNAAIGITLEGNSSTAGAYWCLFDGWALNTTYA